jgi:DNA polymerase-1
MRPKTLVIDGSNLCYRAFYALKTRELTHEKHPTGVIFNSMKLINSLANKMSPSNIIICWDSKNSLRKDQYKEYKANRNQHKTEHEKKVKENFYKQLDEFKIVCKNIGISTVEINGLESDDCMAMIVQQNKTHKHVLITTDNDMYQLLTKNVRMYNFKHFYDLRDFVLEFDIKPNTWPYIKAIAGCPTDNVEGVKGIGIKKAIKLIQSGGDLLTDKNAAEVVYKLGQNLPLVELPFKNHKIKLKLTKIDRNKLFSYFKKYSFKSIDVDSWLNNF